MIIAIPAEAVGEMMADTARRREHGREQPVITERTRVPLQRVIWIRIQRPAHPE